MAERILTETTSLRADAQRNRERILAAAEAVFMERGAHVALEEVAKHAGVGIGTLYRRFPTREALIAATYSARFVALAETSRATSAARDPLTALRAYLEGLVRYTNVYRGLAATLGAVLQTDTDGCRATRAEGERLLKTGQTAGAVRPDITFGDIVCIATAISLATEHDAAPEADIARLVTVFIEGIGVR